MPEKTVAPIFIHSLWRAGSTYLFQVFRRSKTGYYCYQEPLHEYVLLNRFNKLIFDEENRCLQKKLRHPALTRGYYCELYKVFDSVGNLLNKSFVLDGYFDQVCSFDLKKYLDTLITKAEGIPVIQECRTSNRIKALKEAFSGVHLFLWRNPWDQWWSFKVDSYFEICLQLIVNAVSAPELIEKIRQHIGFAEFHDDDIQKELSYFELLPLAPENSYLIFYALWCMAWIEAQNHADLSINIDQLTESSSYRDTTLETLNYLGISGIDFSDCQVHCTQFTTKDESFFLPLEERVYEFLLSCGTSIDLVDSIRSDRNKNKPACQYNLSDHTRANTILEDAVRAREVVVRVETNSNRLIKNKMEELKVTQMQLLSLEEASTENTKALSSLVFQNTKKHQQQMENLLSNLAAPERKLWHQALDAQKTFEQEKAALVQAHAVKEQVLKDEYISLLTTFTNREKEFGEHILQLMQHAEQEKAALANVFANKEQALRDEHSSLLALFANREKEFSKQIVADRQTATAFENQLRTELQVQRQAVLQLQSEFKVIHSSFAWWLTAPLRQLTRLFGAEEITNKPILTNHVIPRYSDNLSNLSAGLNKIERENKPCIESVPMSITSIKQSMESAKTVDELLSYHDEQFVRCVYMTLLGREPDSEGMSYYLGRLRRGYGQASVLYQVSESSEARVYNAHVSGLGLLLVKYRNAESGLLSFFTKSRERKLNILDNQIGRLTQEFRGMHLDICNKLDAFSLQMRSQTSAISALTEMSLAVQSGVANLSPVEEDRNASEEVCSEATKQLNRQQQKVIDIVSLTSGNGINLTIDEIHDRIVNELK